MKAFILKALFRTISIFVSIYLLKTALEFITQIDSTIFRMIYSIIAVCAISLIFILANTIANRLKEHGKKQDGNKNENSN